jgi:hypothetical protein
MSDLPPDAIPLPPPRKAKGRTLAEFWPDIRECEKKLLEACRDGRVAGFNGGKRPETEPAEKQRLRPDFVRFLCLGGDEHAPAHEKGVQIIGGWIEGGLDLEACHLPNDVIIQSSVIDGDLTLLDASCEGIYLAGSRIKALEGGRVVTKGGIHLDDGFHASGIVRLIGAQISGELSCIGGRFEKANGRALSCDGAVITGGFFFRDLAGFEGSASLANLSVGALLDDSASWAMGKGHILDGFRYGIIADGPTDAIRRIAWLDNQRPEDLSGAGFCPQPWQQLIRTLRRMGHAGEADEVAIAFQKQRRRAGQVNTFLGRVLHRGFGLIAGYGYKPIRLFKIMLGVWLCSTVIYQAAMVHGIMAPSNPMVFNHKHYQDCRPVIGNRNDKIDQGKFVDWTNCAMGPLEYTTFSPALYSLDLILPLVELQQDKDWAPMMQKPAALKDANGNWVYDPGTTLETTSKWWPAGVFVRMVMWF